MAGQFACNADPGQSDTTSTDASSGGSTDGASGGASSGGTGSGGSGSGGSGGSDRGSGGLGGFGTGAIWLSSGGAPDPGCAPDASTFPQGSGGAPSVLTLMEQLVPYQEWPALGGTVTGILYVNQGDDYGGAIDHLRDIRSPGGLQFYGFAADGSSPHWPFFESSGEGESFSPNREVMLADRQKVEFASALFGPQTPNPWGLAQEAYIVTLQVNDGGGSPSGVGFVVTDVTILSGTTEVPLNPAQTMAAAADLFALELQELEPELETLLAESFTKTAPTCGVLTETNLVGVWPIWQHEEKTLSLTFVHQHQRVWQYDWLISPGTVGIPPQRGQARHGHVVEYVARYDYDATGTLLATTSEGPIATDFPINTPIP